ncbi:MAG: hypothetical protein U1F11_03310 [Steroidobacteraceae bacterium]
MRLHDADALARPEAPELARFTFFVSRRREEGRERFRLHMGYFATRDEAEQMLVLVREVYPAAWVGEAPGKKPAAGGLGGRCSTRARSCIVAAAAPSPARAMLPAAPAATASAPGLIVAPPRPHAPAATMAKPITAPPSGARTVAPGTAARPAAPVPPAATPAAAVQVRTAAASTAAAPMAAMSPAALAPTAPGAQRPRPGRPSGRRSAAPGRADARFERRRDPRDAATGLAAAPAAASPASAPASSAPARPAAPSASGAQRGTAPMERIGSNVREVLADLDRPVVAPAAAAVAVAEAPAVAPAAPAALPVVASNTPNADLSDSQVLRVLEHRSTGARADGGAGPSPAREISMLSPEDTQTWRDIKAQLRRDATVHFAVQLEWSVAEIDLARVPALAIFNAYTLYKIEGNRDGRKWYGLRLGFFSDAVSAKQVAYYVRSEFAQVAVVPVSVREREQAREVGAIDLPRGAPAGGAASRAQDEAITLIDDRAAAPAATAGANATGTFPVAEPAVVPEPLPGQPNARGKKPPGKTAKPRPDRARGAGPQTLEETLEILGASQLSIDNGRGERLVLDKAPKRGGSQASTFTRLLDKLSEKLRK